MIDLSALRRLRGKRKRRSPVRPARWILAAKLVAAVAVAASVCFAGWALVTMPALCVDQIHVSGTARLSPHMVEQSLASARNYPVLMLPLRQLRETLEEIPAVLHASVVRRLPNELQIEVQEREAVARIDFFGSERLVDASGALFPAGQAQPGDDSLPLLINVATPASERHLVSLDVSALVALAELKRVHGGVPDGTFVDLRPLDRLILQAGPDAPVLWLDRRHPETNLESYFLYQSRVAELGSIGPIDLRFPHRLTIQPAPQPLEDPMTPSQSDGLVAR
ncbi:MAG: FtsQ-type POTRA domain-containing protein [Acidobacteriota bacterium]